MSEQAQAMLAVLLTIAPRVIRDDLCAAHDNLRAVIDELETLRKTKVPQRSAEMRARIAHLSMVQAHELAQMDLDPEIKVFQVGFAAGDIVQATEMVAFTQGKLAELDAQMDAIRKREGLAEGEYWLRDKGPADYRLLAAESEDIAENVEDTILVHVLRRYDLGEYANLYERDRRRFQFMQHIGARVLVGDSEADDFIERHIAADYGADELKQFRSRVNELRARTKRR